MQFSAQILPTNTFSLQNQGLAPLPPVWEILNPPLHHMHIAFYGQVCIAVTSGVSTGSTLLSSGGSNGGGGNGRGWALRTFPSVQFFIAARKRTLGQGNVFTRFCHSVHRRRGDCIQGGLHPRGRSAFRVGKTPPPLPPIGYYGIRSTCRRDTSCWNAFLFSCSFRQKFPRHIKTSRYFSKLL